MFRIAVAQNKSWRWKGRKIFDNQLIQFFTLKDEESQDPKSFVDF